MRFGNDVGLPRDEEIEIVGAPVKISEHQGQQEKQENECVGLDDRERGCGVENTSVY